MFITILLLLIVCSCLLGFFTFQLYKKNDLQLGSTVFIFLVVSFFSVFLLSVYFLLDNSDSKFEDYRYFFIGITSILALCSLLLSSFWSTRTIKLSQDTQKISIKLTQDTQKISMDHQKISFIMDLIKNNYQLLKDKEGSIKNLIKDLDTIFLGKSLVYEEVALLFHEKLRTSESLFSIHEIDKYLAETRGNNKDLITDFKNVFQEDKQDASFKILTTYFSENKDKTSYIFDSLNDSIQNKVSKSERQNTFLNKSFNMDQFIEKFLQEKKVKELLNKEVTSLKFEEIKFVMEKVFNKHYGELGHFFRNSYRVVKLINDFSEKHFESDPNFRKTYLGVLRSYYSENVLLVIYYNSIFTDKGLGYAKQLALSDFFGDKEDLGNDDPIHVRKDKFYFDFKDLKVIKKLFLSNAEPFLSSGDNAKDIETIKGFFDLS